MKHLNDKIKQRLLYSILPHILIRNNCRWLTRRNEHEF